MYDNGVTLVADDEYYRVEIHKKPSILYVLWKCHLEGEILKEKYISLIGVIKRYKPEGWLGNARAIYYTTIHDARWIFEKFIPSLVKSSIVKYARIETPNSLLILDSINLQEKINNLAKDDEDQLEFRFFTDEEMALGWLISYV